MNYEITSKIELVDTFYLLEFRMEITDPERNGGYKK
jgi:hypothetical protein